MHMDRKPQSGTSGSEKSTFETTTITDDQVIAKAPYLVATNGSTGLMEPGRARNDSPRLLKSHEEIEPYYRAAITFSLVSASASPIGSASSVALPTLE